LIDKVKDAVRSRPIADFCNWCSPQWCNELFWHCCRKGILSVHYQIRRSENWGGGFITFFC